MMTVNFQIRVPVSDYCFNGPDHECCEHFDNAGGHPTCDFGVDIEYDTEGRVKKGNGCLSAERVS